MPRGKYIRTEDYRQNMSSIKTIGYYENNNNYTENEIEIIKKFYPLYSEQELMVLLPGRRYINIRMWAYRNGVKKLDNTLFRIRSNFRIGKKANEECKKKMSENTTELWKNKQYREKVSKSHRSEGTEIRMLIRNHYLSRDWKLSVFKKDGHICQMCFTEKRDLVAHHIVKFVDIVKKNKIQSIEDAVNCSELWDINNGLTLCRKCHRKTDNFGNKKGVA